LGAFKVSDIWEELDKMKKILTRLFEHKRLTRAEAKEILTNISNHHYNASEIAAFITVYLMRAISVDELNGFRDALLDLCLRVDLEGVDTIDLCGTGGDSKNTFNISTISSFVVAGAGYKVAKHGNYGVSSKSGSSNVLEALGYQFTDNVDVLKKQLDKANLCFLHAPLFHPAMKAVGPIRRELGIKTFFNMLGPMVNPSFPKYQLVGVFNLELARLYQYIFQQTDKQYAIVHALDGYDEISLTDMAKVKTNHWEKMLSPTDFGKTRLTPESLFGGDTVEDAAKIFMNVLENKATDPQKDAVSVNSGLAIHCMRPQQSLQDCVAQATEAIDNGNALKQFKTLMNL
jgi:anthranilate phosphoribosyltransferase